MFLTSITCTNHKFTNIVKNYYYVNQNNCKRIKYNNSTSKNLLLTIRVNTDLLGRQYEQQERWGHHALDGLHCITQKFVLTIWMIL